MGLKRLFWRLTTVGKVVDITKNCFNERSVVGGVKKTMKEFLCEDDPFTSMLYRSGCYDGKKEGYMQASYEYEEKLLKQAEMFLENKELYERDRDNYEIILDEYEKVIEMLKEKNNRTEKDNYYLDELRIKKRELREMIN